MNLTFISNVKHFVGMHLQQQLREKVNIVDIFTLTRTAHRGFLLLV